MATKLTAIAFRTTFLYILLSGIWILLSDRAVLSITSDPNLYVKLSTYKGWGFVLVTGTLLYITLRAQLRRWGDEIDGRKKAEKELRQNQERLQIVIENSDDVLIMQDRDGRYVHYSGPGHFGVSPSDVVGRIPDDLFDATTAAKIMDRHRTVLATQETAASDDLIRWNGQWYWFSTRTSPARDANDEVSRTVTVWHNVTARKQYEDALRKSEERFQLAVQGANDGLWDWQLDMNEVYFSPRWKSMIGYADEEIPNTLESWKDHVHPDDIGQVEKYLEEFFAGCTNNFEAEFRMQHKDGSYINVLSRGTLVRNIEGKPVRFVGTHVDITERKRAEFVLKEKLDLQVQFAQVAETVPGLICSFLLRPDGSTAMPFATRMIKDVYGLSPDDVAQDSSPVLRLIHPDDRDHVLQSIMESARTFTPWHDEYRIQHSVKGERWIEGHSMPLQQPDGSILWHGFVSDITERKKSEEALRTSEQRFRSFVEQAPTAIFEADARGRYVDMNPEALNQLGYERDELLGKRIEDLTAEGDRVLALTTFWELLENGKSEGEYRMVRKNGEEIWVSTLAVRLDESRYLAFCRDVTARRDAEEQLKASLHEKEILLKEIHHRVKNNLQVISSLISLQAEELKDPAARAAFRESRQRVRSMALIHENLYQSENLASIRIRDYIETVTKEMRRSFKSNEISIDVDVEEILLGIDVAVPCGLIINELLTNALKHAFPGERSGKVTLHLHRSSPHAVRLVVEDDGVGFPEGVDFRSLTSMGMTLVLSLTQQIDGAIGLERADGTRFVLDFPS